MVQHNKQQKQKTHTRIIGLPHFAAQVRMYQAQVSSCETQIFAAGINKNGPMTSRGHCGLGFRASLQQLAWE